MYQYLIDNLAPVLNLYGLSDSQRFKADFSFDLRFQPDSNSLDSTVLPKDKKRFLKEWALFYSSYWFSSISRLSLI